MLLEDVFIINNLKVLNEGKGGCMKIGGTFQRADEENNNKRIYPKSLLMREVTKLEEAMKNRRLMGELDHPKQDSVSLSNVSHLVTSLKMEGNELVGEAEILNTPMGKVAQALIEGGVQIGISSRGMGTLSEGQDGKRYVNEDFRLVTWDIVADPSTRGAFPALSESVSNVNSLLVEEIMGEVLPRVTKQKVFSTLLRERLTAESLGITEWTSGNRSVSQTYDERMKDQQARIKAAEKAKKKPAAEKAKKKPAAKKGHPGQKKLPGMENSSTELFRGVRARLSEMETVSAWKKRKQWEELENAVKRSKVTLPEPKPKPKPKPEKP
tara:strand:- start:1369 stop:2343 length:975 start_codon:yes stop_codon:yes gene_type:complete